MNNSYKSESNVYFNIFNSRCKSTNLYAKINKNLQRLPSEFTSWNQNMSVESVKRILDVIEMKRLNRLGSGMKKMGEEKKCMLICQAEFRGRCVEWF